MASTVRHVGFANPEVGFPVLERRSLAVNTANLQLAVGDEAAGLAAGTPLPLLAIRFFAATAQYVTGDFTIYSGQIWKAKAGISPGPFDPSEWVGMTDGGQFLLLDGTREMYGNLEIDKPGASLVLNAIGASQADIWFRRDGLTRWLFRSDDSAAVDFHIYRFDDAGFVIDAPLSIDRATGHVTVLLDPVGPRGVVSKAYADAGIASVAGIANDRVLRTGDTMSGGLTVPVLTINNPSYSDLYYSNNGAVRWLIRGADATAGNLEFHHYDNAGAYLGAALVLDRLTGIATFQNVVRVPGLQFGGSADSGFYGDGSNVAIRTYGNNSIYFQNAGGSLTYARMFYGGMDVNGIITSTAQDGLRVTVPAGYYARTFYTVSGVRAWTAGVYADGRFAIGDESVPAARMIINLDGSVWFANNVEVPGTLTANTVNASAANISGTGTFGTVNTGSLNVSGNGDIAGNLTVHGTLTATGGAPGGGTGVIGNSSTYLEARGYRLKNGTDGPFAEIPGIWAPGTPQYFNIGLEPPSGTQTGLYVNGAYQGTFRFVGGAFLAAEMRELEDAPDLWGNIKLTKALQEAMARIEALEAKVAELST